MNYWLGVVSKEHVMGGVEGKFAQVCHGKRAPLARLKAGDGFIYYSPKITFRGNDPCKSFTAIGKVKTGTVYQFEMNPDFKPYRIDIEYLPCHDAPIAHLMDRLDLTKERSWGMLLRRGLLPLSEQDFLTIAESMGAKWEK